MTQAILPFFTARRVATILFGMVLTACGGGGGTTAGPNNVSATTQFQQGDSNAPSSSSGGVTASSGTVALAEARFSFPTAVAADGSGNIYVADSGNRIIRKITPAGIISTVAGAAGAAGSADGIGAAARFQDPRGITVDTAGNLYVTDANAVRKITPGGAVTTLAGVVGESGLADRPGTAALFFQPQGITVDAAGNVYVADTGNNAIRKITPAGEVSTVDRGLYHSPHSIVAAGNDLYMGDDYDVWKISFASGGGMSITRWAGGDAGLWSSVDGNAGDARFWPLNGITIDAAGNLYVVESFLFAKDTGAHGVIRKVAPDRTVSTLAGRTGATGSADGKGAAAEFKLPEGITIDPSGNLYVADMLNHTIRKVTPDGTVTTFAGKAGEAGSAGS